MASRQRATGEWCRETVSVRMAQRIASTLQRENARAILRRTCVVDREVHMADLEQAYGGEEEEEEE